VAATKVVILTVRHPRPNRRPRQLRISNP